MADRREEEETFRCCGRPRTFESVIPRPFYLSLLTCDFVEPLDLALDERHHARGRAEPTTNRNTTQNERTTTALLYRRDLLKILFVFWRREANVDRDGRTAIGRQNRDRGPPGAVDATVQNNANCEEKKKPLKELGIA